MFKFSLKHLLQKAKQLSLPLVFNDDDDTEWCCLCGADTGYKKSTPIEMRMGYVVGVGQTCGVCTNKIWNKEEFSLRHSGGDD